MKLRLLGNRIRLRLSQSEVAQIGNNERVVERTVIGNNSFAYSLGTHISVEPIKAEYKQNELRVTIARDIAQQWANSNEVGIQTDENSIPFILIEKDFKCLTNRDGEDESDMFANPNETC